MTKPVYRTVWGQTPKYAANQFAKSYETSRSIGVPEGDRRLVYVQQTPEDTARVGAELENMGYTVVYIDVFDEDVARGIWITADKKPRDPVAEQIRKRFGDEQAERYLADRERGAPPMSDEDYERMASTPYRRVHVHQHFRSKPGGPKRLKYVHVKAHNREVK